MKKICIISYYELKEALLLCAQALEKLGYTVINFPVFQYCCDSNDKRDDYVEYFNAFLNEHHPDVILWWCHTFRTAQDFLDLCENHVDSKMMMMYNWDDPHCWKVKENFMPEKASVLDVALTCCGAAEKLYTSNGCKKALFLAPGFDAKTHFFEPLDTFACDVSMCVTNLYLEQDYPRQFIERKQIVDALEAAEDINFALYGPPWLKERYPRSYKGFLDYKDTNKLFSSSKINISTHVICDEKGYVNERCNLIMACKGLLLVDPVAGIEELYTPNEHMVLLEKDYLAQIRTILADNASYDRIRENGMQHVLKHFTWTSWAWVVHREIGLYYLDPKIMAQEDFLKTCSEEKEVTFPFEFPVPEDFDSEVYAKRNKLELFDTSRKAWIHWISFGKWHQHKSGKTLKKVELLKSHASIVSSSDHGVGFAVSAGSTTLLQLELYHIFSKLSMSEAQRGVSPPTKRRRVTFSQQDKKCDENLDSKLEELHNFAKCNPDIDLSEALRMYQSLIDYPVCE
jgi:hypothetical protein